MVSLIHVVYFFENHPPVIETNRVKLILFMKLLIFDLLPFKTHALIDYFHFIFRDFYDDGWITLSFTYIIIKILLIFI